MIEFDYISFILLILIIATIIKIVKKNNRPVTFSEGQTIINII